MASPTTLRSRRISLQIIALVVSVAGVVGVKATSLIYPYFFCPASPGAVAACPIWMIEHGVLEYHRGLGAVFALIGYLLGLFILIGAIFGRGACGWACPVGFFQDVMKHMRTTPLKNVKPLHVFLISIALILPAMAYSSMALGYLATVGFYLLIALGVHTTLKRERVVGGALLVLLGTLLVALTLLLQRGIIEPYRIHPRPLAYLTSIEFTGFTGLISLLTGISSIAILKYRERRGDPFRLRMGGKERLARPVKYFILLSIAPLSYVTGTLAFTDVDPVGGLVATLPTLFYQPELWRGNPTFFWIKAFNTALFVALSITVYRGWCRYLCPLGALWAPFNRTSLFRVEYNPKRCIDCNLCIKACPMGLDPRKQVNTAECIMCGKCVEVCPTDALVLKLGRRRLSRPSPRADLILKRYEEVKGGGSR